MRDLTSPAREILDYLLLHPGARDTFEGVAQWWILEQSIKASLPKIEQAIAELVQLGYLERHIGPDGVVHYRANQARITGASQDEPRGQTDQT
jgi:hypothetical protein